MAGAGSYNTHESHIPNHRPIGVEAEPSVIDISVIIPNFNGERLLPICLDALRRQTIAAALETIVVDNGSSDGSRALLRQNYPAVRVIALDRNYGFSKAVNEGIRAATGRYVALLNNDTEADAGWLEALRRVLDTDPAVGFCAARMMNYFQRDRLDGAGDVFPPSGRPYKRGYGQPLEESYRQARWVFGASAGAALYRRELFETVGSLDEDFFAYLEDVDLSFRAQLAGFRCRYVPEAVVYHMEGATTERKGAPEPAPPDRRAVPEKTFWIARNQIYVLIKNLPGPLWLAYGPCILLGWLRSWAQHRFKTGDGAAFLAGWWQGVRAIPRFWPKRRAIQAARKISLRAVHHLLHLD